VHWWLSFIKSCNPNRQPDVILVASHADKVSLTAGKRKADHLLQLMMSEFKDHLRISDGVVLMNCKETRTAEMDRLKKLLATIKTSMLEHQRQMPKLCGEITKQLPSWFMKKCSPKCPVLRWPGYVDAVKEIDPHVKEEFLLKSTRFLDHLGEVIFTCPIASDPIIVLKPNWLCTDVIGPMMAPVNFPIPRPERTSEDYVTRAEIQRVFQDVADADLLITLLQEFQLCHSYDGHTFVFPGLLTQTMPRDKWQPTTEPKVVYFGKQVQCALSTDMFSSGFFPRVQTHLMKELENRPLLWRDGAKCYDNLVEGLIKLSPEGRAVNICVRSTQGDKVQCGKMLQQLENIIADVLDECSPGTGTEEKVLSARALKEHRDEFYSYDKEEISKATAEGGTIVHPTLGFTEQVSDLLCVETPLTRNRPELAQALRHVEPILDHLQARNILTVKECDVIRANNTPQDCARALICTVATKGEDAQRVFTAFVGPIPLACGCSFLLCAACMKSQTDEFHCPKHRTETTGLGHNTFVIAVGQKGFEEDARGFTEVITEPRICGVREGNVKLLLNADIGNVKDAVTEVAAKIQQVPEGQETFFIYYHSGHGHPLRLAFRHIPESYRKVRDILRGSGATKSLFILDACHSASVPLYTLKGEPQESSSNSGETEKEEREQEHPAYIPEPPQPQYDNDELTEGSVLWASSRTTEKSGKKDKYSVFTKFIISGLQGGNCGRDNCPNCLSFQRQARDIGAVSLNLLRDYVYDHVKNELPQTPSLLGQQERTYWMAFTQDRLGTEAEDAHEVFQSVLREVEPRAAAMLTATQRTDELQDREDQLNRHRPELLQALRHVEPILDHLQPMEVLSTEECDVIRAKGTSQDCARALLDVLETKGEDAHQVFQSVLGEVDPRAADMLILQGREDQLLQALRHVEPLLAHLQAVEVLSIGECDIIMAKATPRERARALLDTVDMKAEDAYQVFQSVLEEVADMPMATLRTDEPHAQDREDQLLQAMRHVEPILDHLKAMEVLSTEECDVIMSKATLQERARALLDTVDMKAEDAYQVFQSVLEEVADMSMATLQADEPQDREKQLLLAMRHVEPLLDHLQAMEVLSMGECDVIRANGTLQDRARALLDTIGAKGGDAPSAAEEHVSPVFLCNPRPLVNKLDEFQATLSHNKVDIAVVSETSWQTENHPAAAIAVTGYIVFSKHRLDKRVCFGFGMVKKNRKEEEVALGNKTLVAPGNKEVVRRVELTEDELIKLQYQALQQIPKEKRWKPRWRRKDTSLYWDNPLRFHRVRYDVQGTYQCVAASDGFREVTKDVFIDVVGASGSLLPIFVTIVTGVAGMAAAGIVCVAVKRRWLRGKQKQGKQDKLGRWLCGKQKQGKQDKLGRWLCGKQKQGKLGRWLCGKQKLGKQGKLGRWLCGKQKRGKQGKLGRWLCGKQAGSRVSWDGGSVENSSRVSRISWDGGSVENRSGVSRISWDGGSVENRSRVSRISWDGGSVGNKLGKLGKLGRRLCGKQKQGKQGKLGRWLCWKQKQGTGKLGRWLCGKQKQGKLGRWLRG
ncbi:DAPK1, partial [Branchiostoma lanceolatum]